MQVHQAIHKKFADEVSASDTGSAECGQCKVPMACQAFGLFRPGRIADYEVFGIRRMMMCERSRRSA